jgi:hypothetical protein
MGIVVSFMHLPLYTQKTVPIPTVQEAEWASELWRKKFA